MQNNQTIENDADDGVEDAIENKPYASMERKVLIQTYDYAVRTLVDMVMEEDLVLDPDYQRHYRWTDDKASRFIESVALNIPVPVFYLAEEPNGTFSVIDGQQRLTSLLRYLKANDLKDIFPDGSVQPLNLDGLKVLSEMNNKAYADLTRPEKATIAKRPMRCIVVLNESDSTLKFEVFERLNTGSLSLTDQETRNCIYRGSFNEMLKRLSSNKKYQELIGLPVAAQKTMKDTELVLRLLAYDKLTDATDYNDGYTEYLNNYMEENRNIGSSEIQETEDVFNKAIDIIYSEIGPGSAFRKPLDRNNIWNGFATNLINGAIFESQMIGMMHAIRQDGVVPNIRESISKSFKDSDYYNCLFSGTAQKAKALRRNKLMKKYLTIHI